MHIVRIRLSAWRPSCALSAAIPCTCRSIAAFISSRSACLGHRIAKAAAARLEFSASTATFGPSSVWSRSSDDTTPASKKAPTMSGRSLGYEHIADTAAAATGPCDGDSVSPASDSTVATRGTAPASEQATWYSCFVDASQTMHASTVSVQAAGWSERARNISRKPS